MRDLSPSSVAPVISKAESMLRLAAGHLKPQVLARAIGRPRSHMAENDTVGVIDLSSELGILAEPTIEGCDLALALCLLAGEVPRSEAALCRRARPIVQLLDHRLCLGDLAWEPFGVPASLGDLSTTAMATQWPVQVGGGAPGRNTAGSVAGDASAKKRSVLLGRDGEPSGVAAQAPRERT